MEQVPFDKRSGKIWFNNELVDWSNAKNTRFKSWVSLCKLCF